MMTRAEPTAHTTVTAKIFHARTVRRTSAKTIVTMHNKPAIKFRIVDTYSGTYSEYLASKLKPLYVETPNTTAKKLESSNRTGTYCLRSMFEADRSGALPLTADGD